MKNTEYDIKQVITTLRSNNPFSSSVSSSPWKNHSPDLSSLNREASDTIEQLIRTKRRAMAEPQGGLFLGEAGSGKTHMLMRILHNIRENKQHALFVTVSVFTDAKSATWELLREVCLSLTKNQAEVLLEAVKEQYKDNCEEYGLGANDPEFKTLRRQMRLCHLDKIKEDEDVLRFILNYDKIPDDEKYDLILWLMGDVDEDFASKYNLPERDFASLEVNERESAAEKTLIAFGELLEYAKVPMIVCFDQMDVIKANDSDLIKAWNDCLDLLFNKISGVLPLAFLRQDTWEATFKNNIDVSIVERLGKEIVVENCSLKQAEDLIRQRIEKCSALKPEEIAVASDWMLQRLRLGKRLPKEISPRRAIKIAERVLFEPDTDTDIRGSKPSNIFNALTEVYNGEVEKVTNDPKNWPVDFNRLAKVLNLWLDSREKTQEVAFDYNSTDAKYVRRAGAFIINDKPVDCAFILPYCKSVNSYIAALKRGIAFLEAKTAGRCWYITDSRGDEKGRTLKDKKAEFESLGGKILILDKNEYPDWYGLFAFVNKLRNGDVEVPTDTSFRSADEEDLKNWLRETFDKKLLREDTVAFAPAKVKGDKSQQKQPTPKPVLPNPVKPENDKVLLETLSSFFSTGGIHILAVTEILDRFKKQGVNLSQPNLQELVTRHSELFEWMGSATAPFIRKAISRVK